MYYTIIPYINIRRFGPRLSGQKKVIFTLLGFNCLSVHWIKSRQRSQKRVWGGALMEIIK